MFDLQGVTDPVSTILPLLLLAFSGYSLGAGVSLIRKVPFIFLKDLLYGNLIINFIFVSGFVIFGILFHFANTYFTIFTCLLIGISIVGIYLIIKKKLLIFSYEWKKLLTTAFWSEMSKNKQGMLVVLGASLFTVLVLYHGIIIYFHSIFGGEYDSIFLFLIISKSILLGDGLNHDFYLGADLNLRYGPFTPAFDAWLLHSFSYSSVKLFPAYFIFMGAITMYYFARKLFQNKNLAILGACVFLITPSLLLTSSKYSLQQDIPFLFFLISAFYLLAENIKNNRLEFYPVLMLVLATSLLPLSREIGLVLSFFLLFMFPVIGFTKNNPALRAVLIFIALVPLYGLSFYDVKTHGFTYTVSVRLLTVIIANIIIYTITSKVYDQSPFSTLFRLKFIYCLIPLCIPIILLISNITAIQGLYAVFSFDPQVQSSASFFRQFIDRPSPIYYGFEQSLQYIPQIQLMFVTVQMGFIFIIFKIRGFVIMLEELRKNSQYILILTFITLMFITWSYLLIQDIEEQQSNRHLLYLIPLFSMVIIIGMQIKSASSFHYLYYYGIVLFATFYFLHQSMTTWNYHNDTIFAGFIIKDSVIGLEEIVISIIMIVPLLVIERLKRMRGLLKRFPLSDKYFSFTCVGIIALLILTLSLVHVGLSPIHVADTIAPNNWEGNANEVTNFLNKQTDDKNVFSIYVPSIPFFANRTTFDPYHVGSVSSIVPLLNISDSITLEENLENLNIGYIIIPNEQNNLLFKFTQRVYDASTLIEYIQVDPNFVRITLPHFDVYKFVPAE